MDKLFFGDKKRVCFYLDFSIGKQINIEFDGTYFHKNSKIIDDKRQKIIESKGYKVLRIMEEEYKKDKIAILRKCLKFINKNSNYKTRKLISINDLF